MFALVLNPVVRPNNRHSLDVPGPESVKEGQLVSEAVARLGEESLKKKERERFDDAQEEADRGSVVVRFNEASIVNGAGEDEGDNDDDGQGKNTQDSVSDSDDVVQNSAIDSSSDEDLEKKNDITVPKGGEFFFWLIF